MDIKENWKKAPGVKYKRGMINAALAPRDYSVKCNIPKRIALCNGYNIWWCSTHHQPYGHCERGRVIEDNDILRQKIEDISGILTTVE